MRAFEPMKELVRALAAMFVISTAGGCVWGSDDCPTNLSWLALEDPQLAVGSAPESRVEHRVVLNLTPEGATSQAADALRKESRLTFYVAPGARDEDELIEAAGIVDADGVAVASGSVVAPGEYLASFTSPLSDCPPGEACTREVSTWADVSVLMEGARIYARILIETPYVEAGECHVPAADWLRVDVERLPP